ncbi:MAG: SGNH/GDSL hydrolase family protein [Candidatus Omnitrophica bacterium]|nr:SGNH/GDSL hydrolase family protein [Candidatus Omnitrophota bacterium]
MKNLCKLIFANLLVLFVFLLLFEMSLRLFWNMSAKKGELYQKSKNRILRYELKPNAKLDLKSHVIAINSDGFRDKEYPLEKDKDIYRIVFIGDSATFAKGFKSEDSQPKLLEAKLSEACPGKKFEVLNMGVEGYNSIQELEMLKTKGLKYNPDLVIIHYCFNDPDYPEYYFEKNFINRHSVLAKYILYKIRKYQVKQERKNRGIDTEIDAMSYFYTTDCWDHAKAALLDMADLTKTRGIKMILLIVPEMSGEVKNFREGYPYWSINEMLENIKHENMVIIDPIREFSRLNLEKDDLTTWYYPNVKAKTIIADYTLEKLKQSNIKFCD